MKLVITDCNFCSFNSLGYNVVTVVTGFVTVLTGLKYANLLIYKVEVKSYNGCRF